MENKVAKKEKNGLSVKRLDNTPKKGSKIKKAIKNFFKQFGVAIIAVSVVAYIFLQLMLNVGTMLSTENATYICIKEREELTAFLFRNEKIIEPVADGIDCMLVEEGQKVRRGETVAITYSDPNDVALQNRISEINKRLDVLERSSLSTGASTTDISVLDENINNMILEMTRRSDKGEFDKILREKEELLILMNRRQSLIQSNSYAAEISELTAEKEELNSSLSGESQPVPSPESGYFYPNVDGYENIFTVDKLNGLTCEEFESLFDSVPDTDLIENSSGKIIIGSTWYIAVATTKRVAEGFKEGRNYPITFQYSANAEISMTLENKVTRTDKDMAMLIFSTKKIPREFDFSRCQTIELPITEHKGIRVSTDSLRINDGETGVYVVTGTKVTFKKAKVIYSYGSYSVCEIPRDPVYPDKNDIAYSSKTDLSLHDTVITEGSGIYDGMRIK